MRTKLIQSASLTIIIFKMRAQSVFPWYCFWKWLHQSCNGYEVNPRAKWVRSTAYYFGFTTKPVHSPDTQQKYIHNPQTA